MKITIFAAGSRGDIQPCIALGVSLQNAGYCVRMAVPANFIGFVREHNLDVSPLRGDVQQIMSSPEAKVFLEKGGNNPIRTINAMRSLIAPVIREMIGDAFEACRDADALICLGVFSPIGLSFAEALNLPIINIEPTPLLPTRSFPAPSWPIQQNLGGLHNYLSGLIMLYSVWLWYGPFVKEFRKEKGLPGVSARYFYKAMKKTPMLGAYSSSIIPKPSDWPECLHVTGYFELEKSADWTPPEALQVFLDAGDPPVYIGFGSMPSSDPGELADMVHEALEKCGRRGILLAGWGDIQIRIKSDRLFTLDSAPHGWLFPRMAAVVHHGGAGTTAEGLRAGVPTVIIPFNFDQFFWGTRIKAMGLGPQPIPRKKLNADRLANAIQIALDDPAIKQKAAACGIAIRAENGIDNALKIIRQYFGEPDETKGSQIHAK